MRGLKPCDFEEQDDKEQTDKVEADKEQPDKEEANKNPDEVMRLYVFICDCGGEIKIPDDMDFGDDVEVRIIDDIFSDNARDEIESCINSNNRVVVAGPSPRIMERFFNDPNVEFVNINTFFLSGETE